MMRALVVRDGAVTLEQRSEPPDAIAPGHAGQSEIDERDLRRRGGHLGQHLLPTPETPFQADVPGRFERAAEQFGVSVRTVYRDIAALEEAGFPIVGTPGDGYHLGSGAHLKPLAVTPEEAEALVRSGRSNLISDTLQTEAEQNLRNLVAQPALVAPITSTADVETILPAARGDTRLMLPAAFFPSLPGLPEAPLAPAAPAGPAAPSAPEHAARARRRPPATR